MLDIPPPDDDGVRAWVAENLGDLCAAEDEGSPSGARPPARGGQQAADAALQAYDVKGYARRRNNVWPASTRGASMLSPYIRHGLLTLPEVWDHVASGPPDDVAKFRDELRWQEYARHLYARVGTASRRSLRYEAPERNAAGAQTNPWNSDAACLQSAWSELVSEGWLTNQTRMWLASHWNVREGLGWRDGEDLMYRHLLDGSRAANRLGWQWTVGALTGKAYGFSRWQVEKRAPGLCATCPLERSCPIADWPPTAERASLGHTDPRLRRDDDPQATAGPATVAKSAEPQAIWMTAESLSDRDPATAAYPELPVVFVFDEPLLRRLRLSTRRLVFLAQSLADLATRREVQLWRGDPVEVLQGRSLAATFTPVPGWRSRAARVDVVSVHPWPWLERPRAGSVASYSAWATSRR
jgi:deoxyribodipyrimidine photo-lyase